MDAGIIPGLEAAVPMQQVCLLEERLRISGIRTPAQVSDVPHGVDDGVLVMEHDQHGRSGHAPGHGAAVEVIPGGEREQCQCHNSSETRNDS